MTKKDMDDLIHAWATSMNGGTLPVRAISDPDVHALEKQQIFARSWLALALESEIPTTGDFVLRHMGEDQVIVTRGDGGAINVLLNNCRHRGTWLCQKEKGNAQTFRCPYHGWIYRNDGSWIGAPMKSQAYRTLNPKDWGLLRAPKVDVRWGVIFATLDPDAPSFEAYLGDFKFYADAFLNIDSRGYRLLSEPSRWRGRSNWKSNVENVIGDAYHASTLHASAVQIGVFPPEATKFDDFAMFHTGNGHGVVTWRVTDSGLFPAGGNPWGYSDEDWKLFDKAELPAEQFGFLQKFVPLSMTIFPNLSFARLPGFDPKTGTLVMWTWMRICQPHGPNEHVSWNFFMNFNAEPDNHAPVALHAGLQWLGVAGIGDIDDAMAWEGATQVGGSLFAQSQDMQLNFMLGTGDMSAARDIDDNNKGPGVARGTAYNEDNQRQFYSEWLRRMDTGKGG
jgi:phenylpropionate dioxygenase-like ring-hydroxylating dioxygenase large terminal subunit